MTGQQAVHAPWCNIRCRGDSHWLVGEKDTFPIHHVHAKTQEPVCALCVERARDGDRP